MFTTKQAFNTCLVQGEHSVGIYIFKDSSLLLEQGFRIEDVYQRGFHVDINVCQCR